MKTKENINEKIWKSTQNLVLIYIGSAGEFPLNPEVDWLFFTNALPSNPQKRFVETITKQQQIILVKSDEELKKIGEEIRQVHTNVEEARTRKEKENKKMSNQAFIEVGNMIIYYAIKGYEYLYRKKLTKEEKDAVYQASKKFYEYMRINNLPKNYEEFEKIYEDTIENRLKENEYTTKLFEAYKKDIGKIRYWVLKQAIAHFVHPKIVKKLNIKKNKFFTIVWKIYPYIKHELLWELLKLIFLKKETIKKLNEIEKNLNKGSSLVRN